MSDEPASIERLTNNLLDAAAHALVAAQALRESITEFNQVRLELHALLREVRRPPEPWASLNLN
jgi:hypothetical protein